MLEKNDHDLIAIAMAGDDIIKYVIAPGSTMTSTIEALPTFDSHVVVVLVNEDHLEHIEPHARETVLMEMLEQGALAAEELFEANRA